MMNVIDFQEVKCRNCNKCVRSCPVKAIAIKDEHAQIMENQCILCGECLKACPQNAKTFSGDLEKTKQYLAESPFVVASLAPSYLVGLQHDHPGQIVAALKQLGFAQVRETSAAAAYVTQDYVQLLQEGKMDNIITSCCPSVNALIERHYPGQIDQLAPVVSPMIAHGKLLRRELGEEIKVVFIGPCIAKKREAEIDPETCGAVDAVIDFMELEQWLQEAGIDVRQCQPEIMDNRNPRVNRLYPINGGILTAVGASEQKDDYQRLSVHGIEDCMALLDSIKRNEIHHCFIEMSICRGSCIEGPAVVHGEHTRSRFQKKLLLEKLVATEQRLPKDFIREDGVSLTRVFYNRSEKLPIPNEEEMAAILTKMGKTEKADELNCGACGYNTCREKATAVYQGKAELDMCLPYMHMQAQSLARIVLDKAPNMMIMVDHHMRILELSHAAEVVFGKRTEEAKMHYLQEYIDPDDFEQVLRTKKNILGHKVVYERYQKCMLQDIIYLEEHNRVLGIFQDITDFEQKQEQDSAMRVETVKMAQEVIDKQMMVAQQIAELLGETTAETKVTLTNLRRLVLADQYTVE